MRHQVLLEGPQRESAAINSILGRRVRASEPAMTSHWPCAMTWSSCPLQGWANFLTSDYNGLSNLTVGPEQEQMDICFGDLPHRSEKYIMGKSNTAKSVYLKPSGLRHLLKWLLKHRNAPGLCFAHPWFSIRSVGCLDVIMFHSHVMPSNIWFKAWSEQWLFVVPATIIIGIVIPTDIYLEHGVIFFKT